MRALGASRTSLVPGGVLAGPWVRDPLWRRARAVPSLDLRFADNKSLADAVTGASLVTFTRASSGTYVDSAGVIQTASTDVPRFDHNPTTGESLGLLVEEARTNLLKSSQDISTADWTRERGTQSSSSIAKPDGLTSSTPVVWTEDATASATHRIVSSIITGTAVDYAFSVFLKAKERTRARVTTFNGTAERGADVNLSTGTVTAVNAPTSTSIVAYPNGWYRVTIVTTLAAATCFGIIYITDNNGTLSYTGDGTSGIYLWGAQLEAGAFPTSCIPTTTAAVTRSADVASITGSAFSSWYRQDEGTMFAENSQSATSGDIAYSYYLDAGAGLANSIYADVSAGSRRGVVFSGNAVQCATNFGAIASGVQARTAFGLKQDQFGLVLNGGAVAVDSSGSIPSGLTRIFLGNNSASNAAINGTIRRLTFWGQRLSNASLQQITQ